MELALHGWCSDECEDLLQHFISVHLGSRDAAEDPGMQDVLPHFRNVSNDRISSNLHAAAFLHERFASLMGEYSAATKLRQLPWFEVKLRKQT